MDTWVPIGASCARDRPPMCGSFICAICYGYDDLAVRPQHSISSIYSEMLGSRLGHYVIIDKLGEGLVLPRYLCPGGGLVRVHRSRFNDPADLVTHRFPLERVGDAYALMASGRCGKVAVCFDEAN